MIHKIKDSPLRALESPQTTMRRNFYEKFQIRYGKNSHSHIIEPKRHINIEFMVVVSKWCNLWEFWQGVETRKVFVKIWILSKRYDLNYQTNKIKILKKNYKNYFSFHPLHITTHEKFFFPTWLNSAQCHSNYDKKNVKRRN